MESNTGPNRSPELLPNFDAVETTLQPADERVAVAPGSKFHVRWLLFLVALVLIGAAVWLVVGRSSNSSAAASKRQQPPPIPVVASQAVRGDLGVYFTGLGAVTPVYTVTIHTRVDGQLMQVFYHEGQLVHKGDLLAQLDPRPFQVQLTQAQGQLVKDQATLANARIDLARYQELIKRNAVAQQVLATQQSTVAQLEGAVKTDEGQVDAARLNLIYCRIASPIEGRVGLRLVDPGNIVHAADANGLMVITQIRPISVIFALPEDQLDQVLSRFRAGKRLPVDAYDRDMLHRLASGYLQTLDNQIDQTTGTLKLRSMFDNRDDVLFPNQFVNARLLVEEKRGVTIVPTAGIQRNAQNTFVWLVKPDNTVTVRAVTVGTTDGQRSEASSGLQPGDVVVTNGVDKLQEGLRVNAQLVTPGQTGPSSTASSQTNGGGVRGARR